MKDLHKAIADKIVAQLKAGVTPWRKPWSVMSQGEGAGLLMPRNAVMRRLMSPKGKSKMIKTDELWNGQWEAVPADWDAGDPIGRGPTEAAAVEDLRIQMQCEECSDERTTLYRVRSGVSRRLCALHKPLWARP